MAGGEGLEVLLHPAGTFLPAVHGKDTAQPQEAPENRVLEERGLPEKVKRPCRGGSEKEDIEEHVGMVRGEDHRAGRGEALGMLDLETPMEQPSHRPRQGPEHAIQNGLGHETKYRALVFSPALT
jgi:hypothetical protein